MPLYKCNLETIWSLLHLHSGLNLTFLTAILHRGLRNCFFTHSFTFHILFGLLYPLSIWTFISLFYLNFFQFNFSSIPFQFQFNFISISVQFQLKFSSISVLFQFFFYSIAVTNWISSKYSHFPRLFSCKKMYLHIRKLYRTRQLI